MEKELQTKLNGAKSLDEVKDILTAAGDEGAEYLEDANRIWEEIEHHRNEGDKELDLDELDAVSGGAIRNWLTEGCAATCEPGSTCWTNDKCSIVQVKYDYFQEDYCTDGGMHEYQTKALVGEYGKRIFRKVCTKCGKQRGING